MEHIWSVNTEHLLQQDISRYKVIFELGDRDPRNAYLEFGHYAGGYDGGTFGVEGVHHGGEELKLISGGVRQEICIDKD